MKLLLGHSPDADDAFMFYAMAKNLVNLRGHEYDHILQDIETLNRRCQANELDVSAVSFHAFTKISDRYALLPCGASFGDRYGPCLVAKKKYSQEEMKATDRYSRPAHQCLPHPPTVSRPSPRLVSGHQPPFRPDSASHPKWKSGCRLDHSRRPAHLQRGRLYAL